MTEKKFINESAAMALPPLRMILDEVLTPDPERCRPGELPQQSSREPREVVTRLIAHLKDEK